MSKKTAFLGEGTVLGDYWTKRRFFDYLIDKNNFGLLFGKDFQQVIYLDPAIANGSYKEETNIVDDTRSTNYLIHHLNDIRAEYTVFITTCSMLQPGADENTPILTHSDDPFVQNRINLYEAVNKNFGRVLNVHIPELAIANADFSPLLAACTNPPKGRGKLPFAPNELHQFYFPERIIGDVERCIPMGITTMIPAMPPLTTLEIVETLAPALVKRLPCKKDNDPVGDSFQSIHSFHWLDPRDGYFLTKEDQLALLKFYFAPDQAL